MSRGNLSGRTFGGIGKPNILPLPTDSMKTGKPQLPDKKK